MGLILGNMVAGGFSATKGFLFGIASIGYFDNTSTPVGAWDLLSVPVTATYLESHVTQLYGEDQEISSAVTIGRFLGYSIGIGLSYELMR